jgi:hypothetical protein
MKKLLVSVLTVVSLFGVFAGVASAYSSPKVLLHLDRGSGW